MSKKNPRARGEGSVYQTKTGMWRGTHVTSFDENGQPHRQYVSGRSQAEVIRKIDELKARAVTGSTINSEKLTVAQYLKNWLEEEVSSKSLSTQLQYSRMVKYINTGIGGLQLKTLTSDPIKRMFTQILESGKSWATPRNQQLMHVVLRSALNKAVERHYIARNVCMDVKVAKPETKRMQVLSAEEADRFLVAAREHRLYALFYLAVTTGMRQGELLGLQWSDIDLVLGSASIQQALKPDAFGKAVLGTTKTKSSRRRVRLSRQAIEVLRRHREQMKAEGHGSNMVFPTRTGGPISQSNLYKRDFKPLLVAAGVPDIRFHDLRHTAATLLLMKEVHVKVVSEMLGHADISTTLRTYAHVVPSMQQMAADVMDELFGSDNPTTGRRGT